MKQTFRVKKIVAVDLKRSKKGKPYITIVSRAEDGTALYWFGYHTTKCEKRLREGLAYFGFNGSISDLLALNKVGRSSYFSPPYLPVLAERTPEFTNYRIIRFNEHRQINSSL